MDAGAATASNQLIGESYELLSLLGRGGMGDVYLARDITRGRDCAIKFVEGAYKDHALQEVRSLQRVRQWHVVQLYDAGYFDGKYYLVMEKLTGQTLRQLVTVDGAQDALRTDGLLEQVAVALEAIHACGIVHCDLKPDNIICTKGLKGETIIKVLDFGISRLTGQQTDDVAGTPDFMAPEQLRPGSQLTPATDVFAYGLLAYYLLTGTSYWHAANGTARSNSKIIAEIRDWVAGGFVPVVHRLRQPLPAAWGNWSAFDEWLAKCLAANERERFETINTAYQELRRVLRKPIGLGKQGRLAAAGDDAARAQEARVQGETAPVSEHIADPRVERFRVEFERLLPEALAALTIAGGDSELVSVSELTVENEWLVQKPTIEAEPVEQMVYSQTDWVAPRPAKTRTRNYAIALFIIGAVSIGFALFLQNCR